MRPILKQAQQYPERTAMLKEAIPERGTPEFDDFVRDAYDYALRHRGITVKDRVGDHPERGYMVSDMGSERADTPWWLLLPEDIENFLLEHADQIDADPEKYYGLWDGRSPFRDRETGEIIHPDDPLAYHDISRNYLDPEEATEAAVENEQWGVFDLEAPPLEGYIPTEEMIERFGMVW